MIQFANSTNISWDYTPIGYWSTIEVHLGIICACLPTIRALILRIFPSLKERSKHYTSSRGATTHLTASSSHIVQKITIAQQVSHRPKEDVQNFIPLEDLESNS